ncbi:MAG TPA: hypothetical protein VI753_00710 [Anaerolineales bacterium]|nr:hypothetical protein [Anaerolineales bacterium]
MAIQLGSAYGKVILDVTGFVSGLDKGKAGLSAFERSVDSMKTALIALVSSAVLFKFGQGIVDIGTNALMAAARVQELEIINEQLGKNAGIPTDAIKRETAEVREMGIEAAVANQVIAEFIRNGLDLSKASELARVAQDAATISGRNSTEALNGIINGIVTLQPEVIRTNGITINLAQAEQELARSLGKSTVDTVKLKGATLDLQAAKEALAAAQRGEGVDTDKLSSAQSRLANASDSVADAQGRVADAERRVADAKVKVARAQRDLDALLGKKKVDPLTIAHAQERVADAIKRVADAERKVEEAQERVGDASRHASEAQTKLNDARIPGASSALEIAQAEQKVAEAQEAVNDAMNGSGGSIASLTATQKQQAALNAVLAAGVSVAGAYEAAMTTASKIIRSYPRYINDILVNIGTPFLSAFSAGAKAVGEFLKRIGKMTAEGGKLRPMLEKVAASAGLLVDKFVIFLEKFDVEKFAEGIVVVLDGVVKFSTFIIDHWPLIRTILIGLAIYLAAKNFNPFSFGILGIIGSLIKLIGFLAALVVIFESWGISLGTIGAAIVSIHGIIVGTFAAIGAAIASALLPVLAILASLILFVGIFALVWKSNFLFVRDATNTVVTVIKNLWKALMAFLRGDTLSATEFLKAAFDAFGEHVNKVFEKVFGIKDAWGRFLEFMRTALGNFVSYISNVFTKTNWSQLGKYITFGIANGMLMGIPSLILAANRVAESVLAAIKKKLGVSSPSRKAMELGMFTGQGYMLGLRNSMDPNALASLLAKPITNNSSSQQQTIIQNFAGGLTTRQVQGVFDENAEKLIERLNFALGGVR